MQNFTKFIDCDRCMMHEFNTCERFLSLLGSFFFLFIHLYYIEGGGVLLESRCLCIWALSRRYLLNHSTFCGQTLYGMVVHHH